MNREYLIEGIRVSRKMYHRVYRLVREYETLVGPAPSALNDLADSVYTNREMSFSQFRDSFPLSDTDWSDLERVFGPLTRARVWFRK
jgi:hypothetical protein